MKIFLSVNINAPIISVWDALINKDKRRIWWPEAADMELRKGGLFFHSYYDEEGVEHYSYGHVTEVDEPFRIKILMSDENRKGWISLTLNLEAQGNLTNVVISCSSASSESSDALLEIYRDIWEDLLAALKEFIESYSESES